MAANVRMRHSRAMEWNSSRERNQGAATTMRNQKKKCDNSSDDENRPPALTTHPFSLFLSSPFQKKKKKKKTRQKIKQWAKVASVPVERMHAIKAAFLDEVCR